MLSANNHFLAHAGHDMLFSHERQVQERLEARVDHECVLYLPGPLVAGLLHSLEESGVGCGARYLKLVDINALVLD